jgi:hypothetical protein
VTSRDLAPYPKHLAIGLSWNAGKKGVVVVSALAIEGLGGRKVVVNSV